MAGIRHRFVETNGIRMHIADQGTGPLVVLCHGFPELWYSWRHQLPALAEAGFHAVAPDQRGYGQTDQPEQIEAYDILQLTSDIVGLVHALGEEQAIVVGHDWGSPVAWHCALLRPDIFRGLALLSVPYIPRTWEDMRPTEAMKLVAGDNEFYQRYFQEPGKAELELEADTPKAIRMILYSLSGDPPAEKRWRFVFSKSERFLDTLSDVDKLPKWLTEQDIAFFAKEFETTGFRGGLNWYRNMDRNRELTSFLNGAKLRQPAIFMAGEADAVITMYRQAFDAMEENVPNLRGKVLLPGSGHWIQQERPQEVNNLLLEFLAGL